mgnify:CR=1 FL=1
MMLLPADTKVANSLRGTARRLGCALPPLAASQDAEGMMIVGDGVPDLDVLEAICCNLDGSAKEGARALVVKPPEKRAAAIKSLPIYLDQFKRVRRIAFFHGSGR